LLFGQPHAKIHVCSNTLFSKSQKATDKNTTQLVV